MSIWKTSACAAALVAAAGLGAAVAPVAHGQTARVVTPGQVEIYTSWGGGRLGVSVRDVEGSAIKAGQPAGVTVEEVTEDGPAAKAGLRQGDVVVEYDGERVRSVRQFTRLVQESVVGRPVAVAVLRDGQRQSFTIAPADSSAMRRFSDEWFDFADNLRARRVTPPRPPAAPAPPPPTVWQFPELDSFVWRGGNVLGITINDLSPQLAEYFGTKDGVLVTGVTAESVAARAGLRAGDVVTALNGTTVRTPAELRREIQRLGSGEEFTIEVMRDKSARALKGKTEERRDQRRGVRTII